MCFDLFNTEIGRTKKSRHQKNRPESSPNYQCLLLSAVDYLFILCASKIGQILSADTFHVSYKIGLLFRELQRQHEHIKTSQ